MKKVLIISGSPRKNGNSDTLCNEFMKGAEESGNQVEKIRLAEKKLNFCTGCGVCNTTHKCVQKDDMEEMLNKMVEADVIVLATPTYFYGMSGQLKTFIDRTVPRYQEISNKDFYFIITSADGRKSSLDKIVESLRGFTDDCLNNPHEKGIIYGTGVWQMGEIQKTKAMQEAYEMGKNI